MVQTVFRGWELRSVRGWRFLRHRVEVATALSAVWFDLKRQSWTSRMVEDVRPSSCCESVRLCEDQSGRTQETLKDSHPTDDKSPSTCVLQCTWTDGKRHTLILDRSTEPCSTDTVIYSTGTAHI